MVPQIQPTVTTGVSPLQHFADSITVVEPYRGSLRQPLQEKEDRYSEVLYKGLTPQIIEKQDGGSQVIDATGTRYTEKPSRQYADVLFQRNMTEMSSVLDQLKSNLENAEGARFMQSFRERLDRVWEVVNSLPKEKVLFLSAVEEVVRGRRWRDLTTGQVQILEQVIRQTDSVTWNLSGALRTLHDSFIDIYPSAPVDETDDVE